MRRRRWDAIIERVPHDRPIIGAEIGVYKGKLSHRLLSALPNLTLYMVDRWRPYSGRERRRERNAKMSRYDKSVFGKAAARARKVARRFGERAEILHGDSARMAKDIPDGTLDFVFIDASHTRRAVKRDSRAWLPKLRPGGLLCGHDYPNREGVRQAVDEMFDGAVNTDSDKVWWIRV